jgi:hypothetical protein
MGGYTNPKASGLNIYDEGVLLGAAASIDFVGAGVSGGIIGADVTETIAGGTSITEEVPASGNIDGVNKVFTFTNNPKLIKLGGAVQSIIIGAEGDFTKTGSGPYTITFTNAPEINSILRSYY